ncbi:MAG: MmgE/PrpD family protein [Lautropia sp.]
MPERAPAVPGVQLLARFASGLTPDALPEDVKQRAQACVLYGLSVGIAAKASPLPRRAAAALDADGGSAPGPATRLLDGRRIAPGAAAFANAVSMHVRVQEDAHPTGHVGVVVVPAALAMAEAMPASGAELVAAVAAGYEVALRIGRDHTADTSRRGFRSTPLYGVIGAAAAAARLMRLDSTRTAHALALAANQAAGLREFVDAGTEEFGLHAGMAARAGITAVNLAAAGVEAAASTLEGGAGFWRAYGEPGRDYGARLAEGLGRDFELRAVTFKPYPTCQFNRAVIRGMLALRARAAQRGLERLAIHLHPFEADFVGMRFAGPFTTFSQTFMSAPFCAALAWCEGAVSFRGMHEFGRADVSDAVSRILVIADPSRARYSPRLLLSYADGGRSEWEGGEDDYALTWEAAAAMSATLLDEVEVPRPLAAALAAAAQALPNAPDPTALIRATTRAFAASKT